MKLDKVDINILKYLLESHIKSRMYWGVEKHHKKRCIKLLEKLKLK